MPTHRPRTVLITGCSSGFGLEFGLALARRGDRVVATVRDPSRAGALNEHADGLDTLQVATLDVTRPDTFTAIVDDIAARFGGIDALVNNAGRAASGPLETLPLADLRGVFDTNLIGPVALTQAALPHLRRSGRGRVVFVSALGAVTNTPWMGAYCGSKHALDSMAAVLDLELRPLGIRVSSLLPGAFRTRLADQAASIGTPATDESYRQRVARFGAGLRERVASSTDLGPVVEALLEVLDADDPPLRRLIAPGKEFLFAGHLDALDTQHRADLAAHT